MDEFGVFTERYGLKRQGKSAPMAALKQPAAANNPQTLNFGFNSGSDAKPSSNSFISSWNSNSANGSFLDDHDFLFQSSTVQKTQTSGGIGGCDDIFSEFPKSSKPSGNGSSGNSFDYNSIFMDSKNSGLKSTLLSLYDGDDVFGGMPGLGSSASLKNDDVFASFASPPRQSAPIDDLLGVVGGMGAKWKSSNQNNAAGFDDLMSGFGACSLPNNRSKVASGSHQSSVNSTKLTSSSLNDPFEVLESTSNPAHTSSELFAGQLEQISNLNYYGGTKLGGSPNASPLLRPPPKSGQVLKANKVKSPETSSIDELEDFAMGMVRNNGGGCSYVRSREDVRDSAAAKKKATGIPEAQYRHTTEVKANRNAKTSKYKEAADAQEIQQKGKDDFDFFSNTGHRSSSVPRSRASTSIFGEGSPEVTQRRSSGASSDIKRVSSAINMVDDLSSMFEASPFFDEFEEVDGESEERRRARLNRQQRANARAAKAVADMNQRDLQNQWEQEERRRIAENLDVEIKRWAAGKEGNMRALLSSLQYVLWPECGWEPVSLTDLITSTSVKKVYRKASLYVHPDKVQQKGANLQQKYTAEKVFDILKEAWIKFNSEELS